MTRWSVEDCVRRVEAGDRLGRDDGLRLLDAARLDPWPVILAGDRVRRRFRGNAVHLCSIAAVKLGRCGEDCRWCAQSAHWQTSIEPRGLLAADELVRMAAEAARRGAGHFGLVSSGDSLADDEFEAMLDAGRRILRQTGLRPCASFGRLTPDRARRLRHAGFARYNHNLETSARHFPGVCTTHTYQDRVASARVAAEAGLELCCGGLLGIGETDEDRIDLALALRDLPTTVVPLNFLHPIPGTPLADAPPLEPMKILSIVAAYRLLLPDRMIKMAGGRERNLRSLQCLMFLAGADSTMVGNYLTTPGRPAEEDLAMIRDLGLVVAQEGAPRHVSSV